MYFLESIAGIAFIVIIAMFWNISIVTPKFKIIRIGSQYEFQDPWWDLGSWLLYLLTLLAIVWLIRWGFLIKRILTGIRGQARNK